MADGGLFIQHALRMAPDDLFFDREPEIRTIRDVCLDLPAVPAQSCALIGPRRAGTSEIAKRIYKDLFLNQEKILPFWYGFDRIFQDPVHFARDYFTQLVRQYLAFQEKDPSLLLPKVIRFEAVERMVTECSDAGLHRLCDDFNEALRDGDRTGLLAFTLQAPEVLAQGTTGAACVILDHFHRVFRMSWPDAASLMDLYPSAMYSPVAPHILTGQAEVLERHYLSMESTAGRVRRISVAGLDTKRALDAFIGCCERYEVAVDQDAVAHELHRFQGIPFYMLSVIRKARQEGIALSRWEAIRDVYFAEVAQGEIAFYYDSLLNRCCPGPFAKRDAIRILSHPLLRAGSRLPLEDVAKRLSLDLDATRALVDALVSGGLLVENYGMMAPVENPVFNDFLRVAHRYWIGSTGSDEIRKDLFRETQDVPVLTELNQDDGPGPGRKEKQRVSFGLVLPMVSETELVAARAAEQVAERVDFSDEDIGRIRMALIEACINCFEHSGSEDGKIYITFTLDTEKLSIVVEDKGVSFDPKKVSVPERGEGKGAPSRRGWGLELIRNLMDQVVFEDVPVGTRLRMLKYYPKDTGLKAQAG
jgi:anti-sigma regulatory factor (Ser/Thr protein kinase)